jgi:hypothetical protein
MNKMVVSSTSRCGRGGVAIWKATLGVGESGYAPLRMIIRPIVTVVNATVLA